MSHYEVGRGHRSVLIDLSGRDLPALENYTYQTHAPYDAMFNAPTLLLNRFSGPIKKFNAETKVTYLPGQFFAASSVLEVPAQNLAVGGESRHYQASSPVGSVCVQTALDEMAISFFGTNPDDVIEIEGLTLETAMMAAKGLLGAAQVKLVYLHKVGELIPSPVTL